MSDDAEPIQTDTLPGGVCAYSSDLVRDIGTMDLAFSPFGFEDADFAIRSIRAGYTNYVLPEVVAVHDIAHRGRRRNTHDRLFIESRSRALLANKHAATVSADRVAVELAVLSPLRVWDVVSADQREDSHVVDTFIAGFGSYFAGWLSGLTSTPESGAPLIRPGWNQTRHVIALNAWRNTPKRGLPNEIRGIASVALNWGADDGTVDLQQMAIDFPGLGAVSIRCSISGIEFESDLELASFASARLVELSIEVVDNGLLRRLEETIAWRRRERSDGYLRPLAQGLRGGRGVAVRNFLAPAFRGPACIDVLITSRQPTTFNDLWSLSSESAVSNRPPAFDIEVRVSDSNATGISEFGRRG